MLTIKCSKCKNKLFKYRKIGKGKVLVCHKNRIKRMYKMIKELDTYKCSCGNVVGKDEGSYIKMNGHGFTYSGTKE